MLFLGLLISLLTFIVEQKWKKTAGGSEFVTEFSYSKLLSSNPYSCYLVQ